MSDPIAAFIEARLAEASTAATSRVVWQLDHEGRGGSIHATANHAKASAMQAEAEFGADTYWRYDDGNYWLKRDGETIATIRAVQVLGSDWSLLPADIASKRALIAALEDNVRRWDHDDHTRAAAREALEAAQRCLAAAFAAHPDYLTEWSA